MTQAAGEVLQGFSRGLTMFFPHCPAGQTPRSSAPGREHFRQARAGGGGGGAGPPLVLYSTGSFRVSVTSIRSPSRQISMVT